MIWVAGEREHVAAIMAERGLAARRKRHRRGTTRPDKSARKAPDLLKRDFTPPARPDVTWTGDLTEIPNDEGKFYLAAVLDLPSRRCVGFATGPPRRRARPGGAVRGDRGPRRRRAWAIAVRGGTVAGVVFHTDQGGELTGDGVQTGPAGPSG